MKRSGRSRPTRTAHNLMPPNSILSQDGPDRPVCSSGWGRRAAPVPFLLMEAKEEEWAGKGLNRRGLKESAGRFSPIPALSKKSPMTECSFGGVSAAPLSIRASVVVASAVVKAARQLLIELEHGPRIDAAVLRNAMKAAFGASDANGVARNLIATYEVCEAAAILFLRCCSDEMCRRLSHSSPTLRSASIIAVKGFRGVGTSSNDRARTRCGEIYSNVLGLVSGRPCRRTGKT